MRKINLLAAAITVCGAGMLFAMPASASIPLPDLTWFKYCCKNADAYCCSRNGCEISSSGCTRLQ